jgi:hypothetical protein
MRTMQEDVQRLLALAGRKYVNLRIGEAEHWRLDKVTNGARFVYRVVDGSLQYPIDTPAQHFLQYLQLFEMDGKLREEYGLAALATPLVYLPVNRAAAGFQSTVELAGYNESEMKRMNDAASSRNNTQIVALAVGKLAQKY